MEIKFLDYIIKLNGDGVVLSKDHVNPMPGACTFGKEWNDENIDSAKKSALLLFMISRPDDFGGSIFWRLNGRGGAYHEWFTLNRVLKREGLEMPEELKDSIESINFLIGFKNEPIVN